MKTKRKEKKCSLLIGSPPCLNLPSQAPLQDERGKTPDADAGKTNYGHKELF